jgi:hypothetical protein
MYIYVYIYATFDNWVASTFGYYEECFPEQKRHAFTCGPWQTGPFCMSATCLIGWRGEPYSCINCCEHSFLECSSRLLIKRARVLGKEGFWLQVPSLFSAVFSARVSWPESAVPGKWCTSDEVWGDEEGVLCDLICWWGGTNLGAGCPWVSQ